MHRIPESIIPQPLKGDVTVTIKLPPEVTAIMQDLHADRQCIAGGGIVLIVCVVLCTLKHLFTKKVS